MLMEHDPTNPKLTSVEAAGAKTSTAHRVPASLEGRYRLARAWRYVQLANCSKQQGALWDTTFYTYGNPNGSYNEYGAKPTIAALRIQTSIPSRFEASPTPSIRARVSLFLLESALDRSSPSG